MDDPVYWLAKLYLQNENIIQILNDCYYLLIGILFGIGALLGIFAVYILMKRW